MTHPSRAQRIELGDGYRSSPIPRYQGNPLIEALPDIMSPSDVMSALSQTIALPTTEERSLPAHLRVHCVSALEELIIPLPEYVPYESYLSRLLRSGYVARNPFSRDTWADLYSQSGQIGKLASLPSAEIVFAGVLLSGISALGKSTFLNRILGQIPQVIQHNQYAGQRFRQRQIVWLKVDCPTDGTPKGLFTNFVRAMNDATDGEYDHALRQRLDGHGLLDLVGSIAANNFLGVLVIDEIHRLGRGKSGGATNLLNQITGVFNRVRIPIAVVGTPQSTALFDSQLQAVKRAAGNGFLEFLPFPSHNDPAFIAHLTTLWNYQWTKKHTTLTPELIKAYHHHSGGITFFITAVHMIVQFRLIEDEEEAPITCELLDDIAKHELAPLQDALEALRRGGARAQAFEDLVPKEVFTRCLQDPLASRQREMQRQADAAATAEHRAAERMTKQAGADELATMALEKRTMNYEIGDFKMPAPDIRDFAGKDAHAKLKACGIIPSSPLNI